MDLSPEEYGRYCKELEDYLFRRAGGNIIKIVGPTFEMVCGWAARGVPLTIAQRGIDRYVERHASKPRRHAVRIDFCEADVLDVFDEWRRAVGVPAVSPAEASAEARPAREGGLPVHLDRVIARLTSLRAGAARGLDEALDAIVRELDAARAGAKSLRGEARERFLDRLRVLDATLLDAAQSQCDESVLGELDAEAVAQLAPFRERLPADAYERSRSACIERGVRDRFHLPSVAYDG